MSAQHIVEPPVAPEGEDTSMKNATAEEPRPTLRPLQYRSFNYPIHFYYYHAARLTVGGLSAQLSEMDVGFVEHKTSRGFKSAFDTYGLPIPAGCYEAVVIPHAFHLIGPNGKAASQQKGSALGFLGPHGADWLLFDRDHVGSVLDQSKSSNKRVWINEAEPMFLLGDLFRYVGVMYRKLDGKRGIQGPNPLHRRWYDSLTEAAAGVRDMNRPDEFQEGGFKYKSPLIQQYEKWMDLHKAGYDIYKDGYRAAFADGIGMPDIFQFGPRGTKKVLPVSQDDDSDEQREKEVAEKGGPGEKEAMPTV